MIFLYFVLFFLCNSVIINAQNITILNGILNDTKSINVSINDEKIIIFNYEQNINGNSYLRARVEAFVGNGTSVLVILKNSDDQVIHMGLSNSKSYRTVAAERTICPMWNVLTKDIVQHKKLMVEISSQSFNPIGVKIRIESLDNLNLELNEKRTFTVDQMKPVYFLYKFTTNIEHVNVIVNSSNTTCMIFSVQKAVCPVYDLVENVKFKGMYQSVTNSGSIFLQNTSQDKYFIVFVINYNDVECGGKWMNIDNGDKDNLRSKKVTVSIEEVLSSEEYILPVVGAVSLYLSFFVGSLVISFIYNHFCQSKSRRLSELIVYETDPQDPVNVVTAEEIGVTKSIYGNDHNKNYQTFSGDTSSNVSRVRAIDSEDGSFDSLSDAYNDPSVYRLNTSLHVSDLSKKDSAILNRKYFLYLWYLVIISVFYALPVVQLVITYQKVVSTTGNEDMCYYNFRCMRQLNIFMAFNNIISNIGYVLLGVLFFLITWRRHTLYNECKLRLVQLNKNQGIPQYYGLFYAMGVALTMEGILSACYHICPSNNNFQFDTAYMYILACLCMIKIYQTRHPDVNASAHSFYMTMSFIIFVGVIGVVYNVLLFWIFFTISYIAICLLLTMEIYYMGQWTFDIGLPQRIYRLIINDKRTIFIPTYRRRMVFLVFLNAINISFALYGATMRQRDFASFFLAIFMFNLLIYFGFYILMKMKHCEHFHVLPIIYVLVAIFCWGFAIYCFVNHTTDWQLTPAQSREHNQPCVFLSFYDLHDIWHFLSSMSMFFSFLALQNLDDSLFFVDRDKIPVF